MYCVNCSKENGNDASYCAYCGKLIDQNSAPIEDIPWEHCYIAFKAKPISWVGGWDNICLGEMLLVKNRPYSAGPSPSFCIRGYLGAVPPSGNKAGDKKSF
jgi:hypothetical protein